jgi:hypothetical protein
VSGCPAAGLSSKYLGLCRFACSQGYCPYKYCSKATTDTQCPINTTGETRAQRLARLNKAYKGIYWDKAMPDGAVGDCTPEQLSILEEATRVSTSMTADSDEDGPEMEDTAFHRYFVEDSYVQFRWSLNHNARYTSLRSRFKSQTCLAALIESCRQHVSSV